MSGLSEHFGWVEIVFTALIALGFGGYQLWSVNREIARDRDKARTQVEPPPRDDSSVG